MMAVKPRGARVAATWPATGAGGSGRGARGPSHRWNVAILLWLMVSGSTGPALGSDCRRFAVTASDGYANVRANPRVQGDNLVGAVPSGMGVEVIGKDKGWLRIAAPVAGWIAASQVTGWPCDAAQGLSSTTGVAAIERLGRQAIAGDRAAARTLLRMSRGVDGALAEAYAQIIGDWAVRSPTGLLGRLEAESQVVQAAVLRLLDFEFGERQSGERQAVEAAFARLPATHPLAREWRRIKG
jgi:hypothetical protein